MSVKRGMKYVVLFLFLVVFLGVVALNGEDEEGDVSAEDSQSSGGVSSPYGEVLTNTDNKFWAWFIGCDDCDDEDEGFVK